MLRFAHPEWLWLLALIPVLAWLGGRVSRSGALLFPSTHLIAALGKRPRRTALGFNPRLRHLTLTILILALARPQTGHQFSEIQASGIDIVLVIDVSTSMNAMDFQVDNKRVRRIDAVKLVVDQFIDDRPNDRLALLMFASKPYMMSPLTLDHMFLTERLSRIETGVIEDGTAIGTALASAVRRLHDQPSKSRIVILLTDGENNAGKINPMQAAEVAATLKIKVYTIGAGSRGQAPVQVTDDAGRTRTLMMNVDIDEDGLTRIANLTGGRYFRATDTQGLKDIYAEIDRLETTTRKVQGFTLSREYFPYLLGLALLLLVGEVAASQTRWLKLP